MDIIQHILKHSHPAPRIVCKDGFSISVQASEFAYCTPRANVAHWTEVECGFPSDMEVSLLKYAESPDDPTGTVYGYVPVRLVEKIIKRHGGVAE
jgi:hypothetical protein